MDIKKPYKLGDREYRVRYLHKFRVTQLVYGSVTLARCAALPYGYSLPPTTSRRMLNQRVLMYGSSLQDTGCSSLWMDLCSYATCPSYAPN